MKFAKRMGLLAGMMGMALLAASAAMAQAEVDPDHFPVSPGSYADATAAQPSADATKGDSTANPGYAASLQQDGFLESFLVQAGKAENLMPAITVVMAVMILAGLRRRGRRDRRQYVGGAA
jgi:hypothetical protein